MKVVLTVNAAWNAYNFRKPLIEMLLAQGADVSVLAPVDDTAAKLEAMGCNVVDLPMDAKGLSPIKNIRLTRRLRRHFAALQPDVILSYTIKNNIFGAFAARQLGIPFLPNVTGLGTAFIGKGALQRLVEQLYRTAFRNLPVVFFQNSDDRDLFIRLRLLSRDQARCIPGSGIDLQHFRPAPYPDGDAIRFLMISRPLRDKGVLEYVEAARAITKTHRQVRFQILGPRHAENRSALAAESIDQWQAEGVIEHLGETNDVRPFIEAADCIVLPSYREGAPRTLIEAGAMARPVIATDVPGCRDVVDCGRTGFLCPAHDHRALQACIENFMSLSPAARREMGQAGRRRMEDRYDQQIVLDAYKRAIADIATNATPSRPRLPAKRKGRVA